MRDPMSDTSPVMWRISSHSANSGSCVAIADLGDAVAIRNSNHPNRTTLSLTRHSLAEFIAACSAGELDEVA
jgi:hypothetical protein